MVVIRTIEKGKIIIIDLWRFGFPVKGLLRKLELVQLKPTVIIGHAFEIALSQASVGPIKVTIIFNFFY